jgi:hypothetical protein
VLVHVAIADRDRVRVRVDSRPKRDSLRHIQAS